MEPIKYIGTPVIFVDESPALTKTCADTKFMCIGTISYMVIELREFSEKKSTMDKVIYID